MTLLLNLNNTRGLAFELRNAVEDVFLPPPFPVKQKLLPLIPCRNTKANPLPSLFVVSSDK
jgi:hypothetical protein